MDVRPEQQDAPVYKISILAMFSAAFSPNGDRYHRILPTTGINISNVQLI